MEYTAKLIIDRFYQAQGTKFSWDSKYRDVFDYCMPDRNGYNKPNNDGTFQENNIQLFSSQGEQSATEFVNTMQDVLCPPQQGWIDLEAGMGVEEQMRGDVNDELAKLCELANEYKNVSNFDTAFSEFCFDVFAGTACMLVLPGESIKDPLIFRAIPLKEYSIEEGANGDVRWVFRQYEMKKELVKYQWRELRKLEVKAEDACKTMKLIECTYYDNDYSKWVYLIIDEENKTELLRREYDTNPFVVLRWNKASGEPYGRGPGITALNDIRTLNKIKEYALRALAYNLPPLLVTEDAMLDIEGLEMSPLSLNVVPDAQTSIMPLAITQSNPGLEQYKVQELQMDIKRNTFGNSMPNEGNQQLTATEVNYRRMELQRTLTSVFGRLIGEFQLPLVRRIFDVLKENKRIGEQFDVMNIDNLMYKIKVNTPISRALKMNESQAIMGAVGYLIQIDPSGQTLYKLLKVNELGIKLLQDMGVPADYVRTLKEVEEQEQQMAEQAQQAQLNAVETDVQASNAKELGKVQAQNEQR